MIVDFNIEDKSFAGLPKRAFWELLERAALEHLHLDRELRINLNLVSRKTMRELNSLHYPMKEESNVLSLANEEEASLSDGLNGEIYMNYEKIIAEGTAESSPKELAAELFLHSLFHIFGFRHRDKNEEELMGGLISEILRKTKNSSKKN